MKTILLRVPLYGGETLSVYDKILVAELKQKLPKEYQAIPDLDLHNVYSEWSESNWCASWIDPGGHIEQFVRDTLVISSFTRLTYSVAVIIAFVAGIGFGLTI